MHRGHGRGRRERRPAGHHLEQQHPGREQVCPHIDRRAIELLRGHVGRCADYLARKRQIRCGRRHVPCHRTRQTEVEAASPRTWSRNTFDGFRSRCTMPCACSAASASSTGNSKDSASCGDTDPACSFSDSGLPLEQLHHQEQLVPVLGDVVELADVRVADGRGRPRLPPEALAGWGVGAGVSDGLDRDRAVQLLVHRRVDHPPYRPHRACG